jgi:hypothetical protein
MSFKLFFLGALIFTFIDEVRFFALSRYDYAHNEQDNTYTHRNKVTMLDIDNKEDTTSDSNHPTDKFSDQTGTRIRTHTLPLLLGYSITIQKGYQHKTRRTLVGFL